jgi:hypothetical protein
MKAHVEIKGKRLRVWRLRGCIYIGGSPIEQYRKEVQEAARDLLTQEERRHG